MYPQYLRSLEAGQRGRLELLNTLLRYSHIDILMTADGLASHRTNANIPALWVFLSSSVCHTRIAQPLSRRAVFFCLPTRLPLPFPAFACHLLKMSHQHDSLLLPHFGNSFVIVPLKSSEGIKSQRTVGRCGQFVPSADRTTRWCVTRSDPSRLLLL